MERTTKKEMAARLHDRGMRVSEIAERLQCAPSYVANALIERGAATEYVDLYTSTGPQNRYAARLAGLLRFKDVEAARASVRRIDALYEEYAAVRDRCGMHQCQVLALTGKNRAEGIGKTAEALIFAGWLVQHLGVEPTTTPESPQLELLDPDEADTNVRESGRFVCLAA